jgi:homoserine kinase
MILALIGRSMEDVIVEPIRAMLIPMFYEMRELAMENNALGFGISGSGPTVFALCDSESKAQAITQKLYDMLANSGIESTTYVSHINNEGPVGY